MRISVSINITRSVTYKAFKSRNLTQHLFVLLYALFPKQRESIGKDYKKKRRKIGITGSYLT